MASATSYASSIVYGAMVANDCLRSHGQPVSGVRSACIISSRREMSREGVMAHRVLRRSGFHAARLRVYPRKRKQAVSISNDWRTTRLVVRGGHEQTTAIRNRAGAVLRRTG